MNVRSHVLRGGLFSLMAVAICCSAAWAAPAPASDKFAVVQIGDDYQVLQASEIDNTKKRLLDEFNAAKKAHADAKKEAVKNKQKFTDPVPKQKKFTLLRNGLKTQEEAQKALEKIVAMRTKKPL